MMLRRRLALGGSCCLLLLLLALAAPAQAKKASLFDRILAATGRRQAQTGLGDVLLSGEVPDDLLSPAAFAPKEDSWAADRELGILSKMMEGDYLFLFKEMLGTEGIKEVWSEPRAVAHILNGMPMLEGIKGVPEIMAKAAQGPQALGKDDGLFVLGQIEKLVDAFVEKAAQMGSTEGLQGLFGKYQNSEDPKIKSLFAGLAAATEAADKEKISRSLQQAIADDIWGGLIDLDKFGLNGELPRAVQEAQATLIGETPQVWELVTQSDPMVKQILQNPFKAAEIAQEALGVMNKVEVPAPGFTSPIGP